MQGFKFISQRLLVSLLFVGIGAFPAPTLALPAAVQRLINVCVPYLKVQGLKSEFKSLHNVEYLSHLQDDASLFGDPAFVATVDHFDIEEKRDEREYLNKRGSVRETLKGIFKRLAFQIYDLDQPERRFLYGADIEAGRVANVSIKKVNDKIGYGVFAEEQIKKDKFIGEYTGVLRKESEPEDQKNPYIFSTRFSNYIIDARDKGNFTRFINHSRKSANCGILSIFQNHRWHIVLVAIEDIKPGEQLLFNYGSNYWQGPDRQELEL